MISQEDLVPDIGDANPHEPDNPRNVQRCRSVTWVIYTIMNYLEILERARRFERPTLTLASVGQYFRTRPSKFNQDSKSLY